MRGATPSLRDGRTTLYTILNVMISFALFMRWDSKLAVTNWKFGDNKRTKALVQTVCMKR